MQHINKNISEFLTGKTATTISADATVMDAIATMNNDRHDYILVMENEAIVGIFTIRDFLNRVASERLLPNETPLRDVMTLEPDTLKQTDYISFAVERMARYGFRNIPIIDEGSPPAVVTIWDVMSHVSEILAEVEEAEVDKDIVDEMTDTGGG